MPTYTYLATDVRTGAVLAELPLSGVDFSRALGGAGTCKGSLALRRERRVPTSDGTDYATVIGTDRNDLDATAPARCALWVDRDGVLLYGGPLWSRRSDGRTLNVESAGWLSYLGSRRIRTPLTITGADPALALVAAVTHAQAPTGGDVRIDTSLVTASGGSPVTYSVEALAGTTYKEAMDAIAAAGGMDYAIDVGYDPVTGLPRPYLWVGRTRGRVAVDTGLVWEYPGNLLSYDLSEDGTSLRTNTDVVGNGEGTAMLRASAASPGLVDAGYPLLDEYYAYKDETSQAALTARARLIQSRNAEVRMFISKAVAGGSSDPVVGSFTEGDLAQVKITDDRFPDGLSTHLRLSSFRVYPGGSGTPETVELSFAGAA